MEGEQGRSARVAVAVAGKGPLKVCWCLQGMEVAVVAAPTGLSRRQQILPMRNVKVKWAAYTSTEKDKEKEREEAG